MCLDLFPILVLEQIQTVVEDPVSYPWPPSVAHGLSPPSVAGGVACQPAPKGAVGRRLPASIRGRRRSSEHPDVDGRPDGLWGRGSGGAPRRRESRSWSLAAFWAVHVLPSRSGGGHPFGWAVTLLVLQGPRKRSIRATLDGSYLAASSGCRQATWAKRSSTASENRGHASRAHGPNSRSVRTTAASSGSGSTHRKLPEPPKCPKVAGELRSPVQWGRLSSRISKVSPQGLGSNLPTSGRTPPRSGKLGRVASARVAVDTSVGRSSSRENATMSETVLHIPPAGEPRSSVWPMPSGSSTPSRRYSSNGIPARAARWSANR